MSLAAPARRQWLAATAALGLTACAHRPARLPDTWQQDLTDPVSGHVWRLWVQLPQAPAPPRGHPILLVLDGNASFALAAQLARNHDVRPEPLRGDPVLVVGVGHPADAPYTQALRQRDYTPPAPGQAPTPGSGGADLLLDFIAREVLERVGASAAVDPARLTLFGHSFGGLFTLHALFSRPGLFTRYAAASPSIWWGQEQLLREVDGFVARRATAVDATTLRLQLRVGGLETAAAAASAEHAARQTRRRMIENVRVLAERLAASDVHALSVDAAVMPGLDHGAVLVRALIDALALARQA